MAAEPVFDDVLAASSILDELPDRARVDAWVSSALGVWAEDPAAAEIDAAFLDWLDESDDPRALRLRAAIEGLLGGDGTAATGAWCVTEGETTSVGIGFVGPDGSEHSLLADIVDGALAALVVAPGPDELLGAVADVVRPESMPVEAAAAAMVLAWAQLEARGQDPPEDAYVNGALARARLAPLVDSDVSAFGRNPRVDGARTAPGSDPEDGEDTEDDERVEIDRWALSVLDVAGVGPGSPPPAVLVDPLTPERARSYPAAEREAFEALEWADWLGVVIGLCRSGAGTEVEPSMLVDQINRCPEVTSTIPRRDRGYYEWALSLVMPLWQQGGVVDRESRLLPGGADLLVGALRAAWRH